MRKNKFLCTFVSEDEQEKIKNLQKKSQVSKERLRERILNVDDNAILIGGKPQTLVDLYEEISRDWCGK